MFTRSPSQDSGCSCSTSLNVWVKEAVRRLKSIVHKWYSFGIQLGLGTETLTSIEMKSPDTKRCLTEVLNHYIRNATDSSWEPIYSALEDVEERRLASKLRQDISTDQNLSTSFSHLSIRPNTSPATFGARETYVNDFVRISCKDCMSNISKTSDIITIDIPNLPSAQERGYSYYTKENPHGYEHSFYTVGKVIEGKPIRRVSVPTTWATWFPDYKWTIVYCNGITRTDDDGLPQRCSNHLGWIWEATTNNQSQQKFYGLRRLAVCLCPCI